MQTLVKTLLLVSFVVFSLTISTLPESGADVTYAEAAWRNYSQTVAIADAVPGTTYSYNLRIWSTADQLSLGLGLIDGKGLHFDIRGPNSPAATLGRVHGILNVTIPHEMLGGNYTLLINNVKSNNYTTTYLSNDSIGQKQVLNGTVIPQIGDSTTISIEYDQMNTTSIDVLGTTAIPEFYWANLVLTIGLLSTVIAIVFIRTIHLRSP